MGFDSSDFEPDDKEKRPWLKTPESDVDLATVSFCPVLSVETHGGVDRVFTVLEKLPKDEAFLKTLSKKLSIDCRLKVSYRMDRRDGVIEVYGDKRIAIREFFRQEGYTYIG